MGFGRLISLAALVAVSVCCARAEDINLPGDCDKNMPGSMIAIARLNRPADSAHAATGVRIRNGSSGLGDYSGRSHIHCLHRPLEGGGDIAQTA